MSSSLVERVRRTRMVAASLAGVALAGLIGVESVAALTDENGNTIPRLNTSISECGAQGGSQLGNVELCINEYEETLQPGAPDIDAQAAAISAEETFETAACDLQFTVIQRGGAYQNVFGWYNVSDAADGLVPSEYHVFLHCDDPVGTVKTMNLESHPAYKGGRIGLFVANNRYLEPWGNNVCPDTVDRGGGDMTLADRQHWRCGGGTCDSSDPDIILPLHLFLSQPSLSTDPNYVHLLSWQSEADPSSFYFGWEDINGAESDSDFEDLLVWVKGVQCVGSNQPCDTGKPGICEQGLTECKLPGQSVPDCKQLVSAEPETCDGLDNDCDGRVDNGSLCPAGQLCDKGACVSKCGEVVNTCASTEVCNSEGFCVEADCAEVSCTSGKVCVNGECQAPCDGVACPKPYVCRVGRCVDPCEGVDCSDGEVCDGGICVTDCKCSPCADGLACSSSGLCVSAGCEDKSCATGEVCVDGSCTNACDGARCPAGEKCVDGKCEDACLTKDCAQGETCVQGVCVPACEIHPECGPGLKCVVTDDNTAKCVDSCHGVNCGDGPECVDGKCPDATCESGNITCPVGEACHEGGCVPACDLIEDCESTEVCRIGPNGAECVDKCEGVECDENEVCVQGICGAEPPPPPQEEPDVDVGAGGSASGGGAGGDAADDVDAGADAGPRRNLSSDDGGCGCKVGAAPSMSSWWLLGVLAVLAARRRRERACD